LLVAQYWGNRLPRSSNPTSAIRIGHKSSVSKQRWSRPRANLCGAYASARDEFIIRSRCDHHHPIRVRPILASLPELTCAARNRAARSQGPACHLRTLSTYDGATESPTLTTTHPPSTPSKAPARPHPRPLLYCLG